MIFHWYICEFDENMYFHQYEGGQDFNSGFQYLWVTSNKRGWSGSYRRGDYVHKKGHHCNAMQCIALENIIAIWSSNKYNNYKIIFTKRPLLKPTQKYTCQILQDQCNVVTEKRVLNLKVVFNFCNSLAQCALRFNTQYHRFYDFQHHCEFCASLLKSYLL